MTKPVHPACYPILLLAALGCRLIFFYNHGTAEVFGKYPYFAQQLLLGRDLGERLLDLSPLYLYSMAFCMGRLGLSIHALEAVQLILGALNVLLIFAAGRRLMGPLAGFSGALLYALHGNIMALESTFEPLVLLLFLSLLCILYLVRAQDETENFSKRLGFLGTAGLFAGLALITKPNFGLFCLGTAFWLFAAFDPSLSLKRRTALAAVFCVLAGLIVLPISVRNYIKFDDFIAVSDSYGRLFYNGNGGAATAFFPQNLEGQDKVPDGETDPDHSHVFFRERASAMAGRDLKPSESARFWFLTGLRDLKADPKRAAALWSQKTALFFHGYENHLIDSAYFKWQWTRNKPFIPYILISALALVGMILNQKHWRRLFPLYCLVFTFLISCTIFLAGSRYRAPALPALCLFAGSVMAYMQDWVGQRDWKKAAATALAVALLIAGDSLLFKEPAAAHDRAFRPELRRQYEKEHPESYSPETAPLPRSAASTAPAKAAIPPHIMA